VEETLKIVEMSGFEIEHVVRDEIPYMHSPADCQKRFEKVLCFSARKVRSVDQPPAYSFSPSWLQDLNETVPLRPEFQDLVLINRTFANIVALVDGNRSISALAELVSAQLGVEKAQAETMLVNLLRNLYEGSIKGDLYKA
jgi:hypothetical protein